MGPFATQTRHRRPPDTVGCGLADLNEQPLRALMTSAIAPAEGDPDSSTPTAASAARSATACACARPPIPAAASE